MPDNSPFSFGFAFTYRATGRPVKSRRRQIQALYRFFESEGEEELPSIHLVARWRNPADKSERSREWKTSDDPEQTLGEFYATTHGISGPLGASGFETQVNREYEAYSRAGAVSRKAGRSKGSARAVPGKAGKVQRARLGKKAKIKKRGKRK